MAKTTNDDIVEAIENVEYPVARAKDVADQVAIGQRAVLNRLESLVDDGRVERLDVGAKSAVFWNADRTRTIEFENGSAIEYDPDVDEVLSGEPPAVEPSIGFSSRSDGEVESEDTFQPSEPQGEVVETVVETVVERVFENVDGSIDLPGSGTKLEERREALQAAVWYLVENESASRSDFEEDVYPDHPARYETAYSWWKNAIMGGLGDVADDVDAIERADYSGEWRFVGFD